MEAGVPTRRFPPTRLVLGSRPVQPVRIDLQPIEQEPNRVQAEVLDPLHRSSTKLRPEVPSPFIRPWIGLLWNRLAPFDSVEQRRLLFDGAIENLDLPLPRGEMQITSRSKTW
jgi:hypothetical protein